MVIAITGSRGDRGVDNIEDLVKFSILPCENRSFQIGASLRQEERVDLLLTLVQNMDVFAWSPYDVPGVNPKFILMVMTAAFSMLYGISKNI